ncbi:MAG: hypothetical protein KAI24_16335 [Planctomycetes bacterium]|nr:hypothetical protein [Planctomycetota bacterium]
MHLNKTPSLLAAAALAAPAFAQVPPVVPYPRSLDLLIVDSTYDGVWRAVDWNQDGDLDDAGEVLSYYSDAIGSIVLGNPSCIAVAADGTAYVGDSSSDIVMALRDGNGDGDANDPGEHRVFFDDSNPAGIVMASIQSLHVDALGRVFLAIANSGSTGVDMIVMLHDQNGDGDALDAGEAVDYHTVPGSVAAGDSIPSELAAGVDLALYYAEAGATGVITKGVYRLFDSNFDGDCNDPGERSLFWDTSTIGAASPFHYGMAIATDGRFYLSDHSSNETLWTARDANNDGVIDASEQGIYYQTAGSTWWDVVIRDDGAVLLCDDQTPDRITLLRDLNGDGDALDAGEAIEIYTDTIAANGAVRPRGAAFLRGPELLATPATVAIGGTTSFVATTNLPGQLAAVFLSLGLAGPVSAPPFGMVEVDAVNLVPLGFGLSDANQQFTQPLVVPNTPAAIGTLAAQAICGDGFRLFLSNATVLTVTP